MDGGKKHGSLYNMDHPRRGIALIINNCEFDRKTGMGTRTGTDFDADNLYQTFNRLGFEIMLFNNLTCSEIRTEVQNASMRDHSDADCFVMCVLSHGNEVGIYGTDGVLTVKRITSPFIGGNCTSLIGKPKLFFIQACRGDKLDHGVVESDCVDSAAPNRLIPSEADVLIFFSTTPGHYAWRNPKAGSCFVEALCKVMAQYGETEDIVSICTKVTQKVGYEFKSKSSDETMKGKKQIPNIWATLTRKLYFHPKKT